MYTLSIRKIYETCRTTLLDLSIPCMPLHSKFVDACVSYMATLQVIQVSHIYCAWYQHIDDT